MLELIDTLWNVNDFRIEREDIEKDGINRYIMECKYQCASIKGKGCI